MSRPSSLSDDLASTTNDVTTTFNGYNPASQLLGRSRSNDLYAFGGYVTASRAYAVNGLNQYATAGTATFTYDANGDLTGDGTNTYTYDVENRMLTGSGPTATTLQYDPMGRLWRIVLATKTIEFLYDGDAMVIEYNGTTGLGRYVHGDGEDDPLILYYAAGNFGRFQYTGQLAIGQLGLYYYKARMYSPTRGRFMQTGPIGYKDQNNLYAYVGNDPVDGRDPSGLCPVAVCGAVQASRWMTALGRISDRQVWRKRSGRLWAGSRLTACQWSVVKSGPPF